MGANAGKDQISADSVRAPLPQRPVPLQCYTKKKCFKTETEAQPYVYSLANQEHPSRAKLLNIYRCRGCGWLHVGHNGLSLGPRRRGRHAKSKQVGHR